VGMAKDENKHEGDRVGRRDCNEEPVNAPVASYEDKRGNGKDENENEGLIDMGCRDCNEGI
jgi:hypothetical protein